LILICLKEISMTVRTAMSVVAMAVAAVFSLSLGGCGGAVKYDITVTRDESIKDMSVQVDLIGVNNPSTRETVAGYDVNKYWAADGALRKVNVYHSMQFVSGGPSVQTFSASNEMWNTWQEPKWVVVIALIPGVGGEKGADPRRKVLTLDSKEWKERKLDIRVDSTGVRVLTPGKSGY